MDPTTFKTHFQHFLAPFGRDFLRNRQKPLQRSNADTGPSISDFNEPAQRGTTFTNWHPALPRCVHSPGPRPDTQKLSVCAHPCFAVLGLVEGVGWAGGAVLLVDGLVRLSVPRYRRETCWKQNQIFSRHSHALRQPLPGPMYYSFEFLKRCN